MAKWYNKIFKDADNRAKKLPSWLRSIVAGSFYKLSNLRGETSLQDIKTQIDTMRALARDSQISTALSYYATDATTTNSSGQVIWATPVDAHDKEGAEIVNELFKRWNIVAYARDHILELATIGNLYLPTTHLYREDVSDGKSRQNIGVALDNNKIEDRNFDIVPSYKIPPEDIVHVWYQGQPMGYIMQPSDESSVSSKYVLLPESSVIHFSLGGLMGEYTLTGRDKDNNELEYDIQFAQPLMESAVQPTQTLTLLEDALLLSSLSRVVKFINVEVGNAVEEDEIRDALQQIKDAIEQQLSLNTASGDVQSFVNPQSPNNLIYVPKVNGQDAISVTDLAMTDATESDNKLLQYYQDKKLSVLGVPKEAMNFSGAEGLGNAGSVMSQRSALYANALMRLETAYMTGWKQAIDTYFTQKNLSGFVGSYELHMNPILTELSQVTFDKRDAALAQAQQLVEILKTLGVESKSDYKDALIEILAEIFPKTGAAVSGWNMHLDNDGGEGGSNDAF